MNNVNLGLFNYAGHVNFIYLFYFFDNARLSNKTTLTHTRKQ